MKLEFFDDFQDPYLQTSEGQGIFLSGLILGMLARGQAGPGGAIDSAPMYKQIRFGRMQRRDLLKHLARVPELGRAYRVGYAGMLESLCAEAGRLLLEGKPQELGVEGNFAFAVAFLNAPDYFWGRIFKKRDGQPEDDFEIAEEGDEDEF
ncbi:MAG: CRISPR-associated protein [Fretibacterium sp.]|mgnify:CR=1 FL=1|nr:CRISPR-associated protein [Fretibacterium sp.]